MAKREKRQRPPDMTRKYRSRLEKEQRQIRAVLIGTALVAIVSVLVLLVGLYQTQVAQPAATRRAKDKLKTLPAATVNGDVISIADWQARVRFERMLNIEQIAQISQQLQLVDSSSEFGQQFIQQGQAQIKQIENLLELGSSIGADVINQMVEEQLIRQEAARQGIFIAPEELQRHIEVNMFYYPYPPTSEPIPTLPPPTLPPTATVTPEPTVAPTTAPTPRSLEDFEASYGQSVENIQAITEMSEEMWRSMVEGQLYYEKLLETFEPETVVQQVKGNYILTQDRETADALLAQLEAGRTFEELMEEIEADESEEPAARAGSFDWSHLELIIQRFNNEFAVVSFNTEAGRYSREPILATGDQFYLVYIEGNEERELSDYYIEQKRQELFETWLDQQKREGDIVYGDWNMYVPLEPGW
jgi:parvulin-like peptidyl-prolyl isomerase